MATATLSPAVRANRWHIVIGWVLSVIPVLMLLFSCSLKFAQPPGVVDQFTGRFGYPARLLTPLGIIELSCALLFIFPRTAVLGAILVTGYLGGAVATHVRILDPGWLSGFVLGIVAWGGLFLRDPRLRALLPLRRP